MGGVRRLTHARDYSAIAKKWARAVVAGRIVQGKFAKLACQRHLDDLKRKDWDYRFDRWHADDVCDFIEKLPHVEGVWATPTIHLEPPQIFILVVVFGWRRKVDGLRRFSSVYIEMARKGAKSTLTAGVSLYCLCCENEPGAQVIIGATTGEQAQKVFGPAKKMVEKTAALREAFGLQAWSRSITCADNDGFIQPINSKGKTQDGWNPHLGVLDELHAHQDRALFDVVSSAFGARDNPLRWVITTAGFNTNGVCYEQRTYVAKVLEGILRAEHYFGIIFTIDEGDDPFNPKVWIKANPMLGVTPKVASLANDAADAKASPQAEGEFKTKKLNVWLNAASAWLSGPQWKVCADPTLDWADFDGLDCWIGGDLADKDDITALALTAFDLEGRLLIKTVFWLPEAVMSDRRKAEMYAPWVRGADPALLLTPGDWVDHNAVEDQVRAWIERYAVRKVTFDQFAAAQAMAVRLNEDLGSGDEPLAQVLHKKASSVTDPARELEARVKGGPARLRHDDNPVMNWMASNVVVARRRDETILPIKESQMSPNKIDGIDAVVNAIEPAVRATAPAAPSYLEDEEPLIL